MTTCDRCPSQRRLHRLYDDVTDCTLTLCDWCFGWFANGRRKGGLPVPNARKVAM